MMKNDIVIEKNGDFVNVSVFDNSPHDRWLLDTCTYVRCDIGSSPHQYIFMLTKTHFNEFVQYFYSGKSVFGMCSDGDRLGYDENGDVRSRDFYFWDPARPPVGRRLGYDENGDAPVPTVPNQVVYKISYKNWQGKDAFICANGVRDTTVGQCFTKKNQVSSHTDKCSEVITYELVEVARVSGDEWLKNVKSKPKKK